MPTVLLQMLKTNTTSTEVAEELQIKKLQLCGAAMTSTPQTGSHGLFRVAVRGCA